MGIRNERLDNIGALAESIADEYCPNGKVNPRLIADNLGISVSFGRYSDSFDGLLEYRKGRFHIYCNLDRVESQDSPRARFTVGHELGHYFIDEHRNALISGRVPSHQSLCEFESDNPVEREADFFSANLLLPKNRFMKSARQEDIGLGSILYLSSKFGASVTSTAIRYVEEAIGQAAIIKWNQEGYQWKKISDSFYKRGFRKTIESTESIARQSATWLSLSGDTPPPERFFTRGSTIAAWFPYIDHSWNRNDLLIEQAISLGRFGILTMLYIDGETLK